jgi:hypothetical protein
MANRSRLAMGFEILGKTSDIETIATGKGIREIERLRRAYGRGRWRKRKGVARVRLDDGSEELAEIHGTRRTASDAESTRSSTYYEAQGKETTRDLRG